ncbi:MAG: chitobiase/beta-hexosaminidase C-terminal domain-containing protein [Thiohalomonadales bacterium]
MRFTWIKNYFFNIITISLLLSACSDGIDGTGVTPKDTQIKGTATEGTVIANKTITIKGSGGNKVTGTTNENGKYSIDVTNLTAPYLLKVERNQIKNTFLYSITTTTGVTNIHPFTDLITRNWFKVKGYSAEIEFEGEQAIKIAPTLTEINAIENAIKKNIKLALNEYNLNENYKLFSDSFSVNNSSFNKLLKQSNVEIWSNKINVSFVEPSTGLKSKLINNVRLDKDLTITNGEGTKPLAPTSVYALTASTTSIKVVWKTPLNTTANNRINIINVAGYNIYRDNVLVKTTPFTFFEDTELVTRTQYCYEIEAIDSNEAISLKTLTKCATTFDDNATDPIPPDPIAATNLTVRTAGINGALLFWMPPTNTNMILYYDIYRGSAGNVNSKFAVALNSEFEEYSVITKTENTCFTVVAINAVGKSSPASNEACIGIINDTTPPITTANPGSNTFALTQLVRLSCMDSSFDSGCSKIYYTTDGSNPNRGLNPIPESVKTYSGPIPITSTTTIRFISLDKAGNIEDETKPENTQTYTINPGFTVVPGIEFSSANYQVSESRRNAIITVRRNGDASAAVTVDYDVIAGTAVAGQDIIYTSMTGNFYWSENDASSQRLLIPIRMDAINDPDKTVILTLQNPSPNTVLATNSSAILTISDVPCNGIINGPITVDTVITEPCNAVTSDIQVSQNANLTISPGVTLIFQTSINGLNRTGFGLIINNGSFLKASGTAKQPIYFTSDIAVPGYWKGIRFTNSNDINNILNYVTVEYGGGINSNGNGNIILTGNSSVLIENSTITNSDTDGISVSTSSGATLRGDMTTNSFSFIGSGSNINNY